MGNSLKGLIEKKKKDIVQLWFEATIQTYAPDTAQFYKGQKDQFANPVGTITSEGISFLLDQLLGDFDTDAIKSHLDPIVRIRAVQDFTPSKATVFILLLKNVLRDCLSDELQNIEQLKELLAFETRIDQLSLMAFDLYMGCREKIYEIAAHETRNQTFRAFKRAGLIVDPSQEPRKQEGVKS
ncbi:MAG: RsbRD N-terminal domain-containing protein [Deltaproteobacteria bacterium]|nr:RsbRD N-terminal domain-containing protein [Deltaproteobacteria bacterium]